MCIVPLLQDCTVFLRGPVLPCEIWGDYLLRFKPGLMFCSCRASTILRDLHETHLVRPFNGPKNTIPLQLGSLVFLSSSLCSEIKVIINFAD